MLVVVSCNRNWRRHSKSVKMVAMRVSNVNGICVWFCLESEFVDFNVWLWLWLKQFHQYQVVGRALPTESDEHPKIYRMKLWATNEVRAKSKFWYAFFFFFFFFQMFFIRIRTDSIIFFLWFVLFWRQDGCSLYCYYYW